MLKTMRLLGWQKMVYGYLSNSPLVSQQTITMKSLDSQPSLETLLKEYKHRKKFIKIIRSRTYSILYYTYHLRKGPLQNIWKAVLI